MLQTGDARFQKAINFNSDISKFVCNSFHRELYEFTVKVTVRNPNLQQLYSNHRNF